MKFFIEQLVLWPVNEKNKIHSLTFESGKINIIHGRSRTGKSSVIAIIDYCLGASRCAVPVGIIRDHVEWFGIVVKIRGVRLLLSRRTPRNKQVSNEFYLKTLGENEEIPEQIFSNYNDNQIKNLFNNKFIRLTNTPQTTNERVGRFDGRPSYRDLVAFNFLPQHIVANPNTLFYKADSYQHKERLKKILPLALGIVNNEYLLKERERVSLQKELDGLNNKQEAKSRSMSVWESDIESLWSQSVELGLVGREIVGNSDAKIDKFKEINNLVINNRYEFLLESPDYLYTNQKYKEYISEEEELQKKIDRLRYSIRGYENLSNRAIDFSNAINIEKSRLINFSWIKKNLNINNECIACGSETNQIQNLFSNLELEVNKINQLSGMLSESPIVDKEIEKFNDDLKKIQHKLQEVRVKRLQLEKIDSSAKDSLSSVFILIGRIQSLLIAYAEKNNDNDLSNQIRELNYKINELDNFFMHNEKIRREKIVYNKIGVLISEYVQEFKLEQRGTINLDSSELTLSFNNTLGDGKKEYLWEVGSGANWMGYHIATFLGLHEFLSSEDLASSPVFSFLVIDQPSQVYFPSAISGANELDASLEELNKLKNVRQDDLQATKHIFEMLELGLERAGYQYQIIVLEHADESIWGDQPNVFEVANWKGANQGLIPLHWLE